MSYENIKDNLENLFFKNSYNITGVSKNNNEYKHNSEINPIKQKKSIKNKYIYFNTTEKIDLIKKMLNKHPLKQPYDGFAIQGHKYTIESLLLKSFEKEKKVIFEKNKLCKNNYPLIKFLSNRKTRNNTKKLLIQMLSTECRELTKAQENTIKYQNYKPKSLREKINKNILKNIYLYKSPKLNENNKNIIQYPSKLIIYFNMMKNNEIKEKLYLTQRNNKNSIYASKKHKDLKINIKGLFNNNTNNNRPETQRVYTNLGLGETVNLDNHEACKMNNNILLNRIIRKKYLKLKNDELDYIDNDIINDISKLKYHNKIMPLNTKVLTI